MRRAEARDGRREEEEERDQERRGEERNAGRCLFKTKTQHHRMVGNEKPACQQAPHDIIVSFDGPGASWGACGACWALLEGLRELSWERFGASRSYLGCPRSEKGVRWVRRGNSPSFPYHLPSPRSSERPPPAFQRANNRTTLHANQ
eukprot:461584-Pyramimonas_sp.AAC.1